MVSKYIALLPSETAELAQVWMYDASVTYLSNVLQYTKQNTCICMQLIINAYDLPLDDLGGKWSNLLSGWLERKNVILSLKSDWRGEYISRPKTWTKIIWITFWR